MYSFFLATSVQTFASYYDYITISQCCLIHGYITFQYLCVDLENWLYIALSIFVHFGWYYGHCLQEAISLHVHSTIASHRA